MDRETIYKEWVAADEAWSAEGRRIFGKAWGERRYTDAGKSGKSLRKLWEQFDAWRRLWEATAP